MRNSFEIKPLKGKGNFGKHIFYDCESIDLGTKLKDNIEVHKAYLICAEMITFKKQSKKQDPSNTRKMHTSTFESTKVEDFWTFLENNIANTSKMTVWAHNQGFDSRVSDTLKYFFAQGWKRELFVLERGCFIVSLKKSYGKDKRGKAVNKKIVFQDLGNYFKSTLEKIGSNLGIKKGKFDHNKAKNFVTIENNIINVDEEHDDFKDCLEYCRQDVKILKEAFLSLNKFCLENQLGNIGYTASGMSMNAWRTRFLPKKVFAHSVEDVREMERKGYFGGRVIIQKEGEYEGKFYKIDVNSMYPSIMKNNVFPKELKAYVKRPMGKNIEEELAYINERVEKGKLVIIDCELETNEPFLPLKINKNGGFYPVGNFRTVITNMELEELQKVGRIKKIFKYAIYQGGDMFTDFIDFFYNKRLEYKSVNNDIYQQCCKLIMNSLYGKFAQYQIDSEIIGEVDDGTLIKMEKIYCHETKQNHSYLTIGGVTTGKVEKVDKRKSTMTAVSLFVTSYARLFIWKTIKKIGIENIYYGDTDSLIINEIGFNKIKEELDNNKLGYWGLEDTAEKLKIISPKVYWFGNKLKHKGLSKENIKQLELKYNKTGKYPLEKSFTQIRFMQTKTAINKGDISCVEIGEMKYSAKYELTQGWISDTGEVLPLMVKDNKVLSFKDSYPQLKLRYPNQEEWISKKYNFDKVL